MWFDRFLEQVKKNPHAVAIRFQRESNVYDCLTYENLNQEILLKYSHLKNRGIRSGDTIAYLSKNSIEHLSLLIAANMLGASLVSLNFRLAEAEILEIVHLVDPKLLILSEEFSDCSWDKKRKVKITELSEPCFVLEYQCLFEKPYQPCLILFTSGSTGQPKGVIMHSKMLETNIEATVKNWGLEKTDKTIVETPFFHTGGYNVLCLPLLSIGGECVLKEKFDALESLNQLKQFQITVYFGVPTMFQMMLDEFQKSFKNNSNKNEFFSSVRFFVSGGAPIQKTLIEKYLGLNVPFKQGFGMTEVGPNCFLLEAKDAIRKLGSIGRPMSHLIVRVRHESGRLCREEEIGELELGGDLLCLNYFKNENLFHQCRKEDLLKTGDLVKFDDEGYFYVVGRKKNMFISGGENVYPAEVERAIDQLKLFSQVIVVPVKHSKWGEVGLCFYQIKEQLADLTVSNLKGLLEEKISKYKVPHFWVQIPEMPLLANGKIDRNNLKELAEAAMCEREDGKIAKQNIHFMV